MRNMSFALTTQQIRDRSKTVTWRLGWLKVKVGQHIQACVKCMGLKPGEKIERLCVIRVTDVRRVALDSITFDDVGREGFPGMSPAEFVRMFCNSMDCKADTIVTRIEFDYVADAAAVDEMLAATREQFRQYLARFHSVDVMLQNTKDLALRRFATAGVRMGWHLPRPLSELEMEHLTNTRGT